MASEATSFVLGDLVELVRGTTYKGALVGEPGPPLLGLGSITPGGGFRALGFKTYGGECPEKIMVAPGGLYVSLKGATKDGEMIGSIARVPQGLGAGRLTQDTVGLRFRAGAGRFSNYVYWGLRTPHYRQYCGGHATGSAVVALSRSDFLSYQLPPLTRRRENIVELLEVIDDKIELNRRMSKTLEEMARALFKSWFVNFDPVRAKAEGRDTDLPPHIADLFPDRLIDSALGPIPQGWDTAELGDVIALEYGKPLKAGDRNPGPVMVVGSNGVVGQHDEALQEGPGIVLGRKGTPGVVTWVDSAFHPIDTTFYVVPKWQELDLAFLYRVLQTARLDRYSADSAVPGLNRNTALSIPVVKPPVPVAQGFSTYASVWRAKQTVLESECNTLRETRDALLRELIG